MPIIRTDFIGYPVDNLSLTELLDFASRCIAHGDRCYFAVQNANKMYLSEKNAAIKRFIAEAEVVLPENAINIGMRLLRTPLKQRNMGGVHVMEELLKLADREQYRVALLGGTQRELGALMQKLPHLFPGVRVAFARDGYFRPQEEQHIVEQIHRAGPNILFIGLGSPKQELFIAGHQAELGANILIGVGGSFKVLAGLEKPAPRWAKHGLEWLYRSWHDPKKLRRYLVINSFYMYKLSKYLFTRAILKQPTQEAPRYS